MGLFDFISSFKSTSKNADIFKDKYIELIKYLTDYSFDSTSNSWTTFNVKVNSLMMEMVEMCDGPYCKFQNPKNEFFNVYTNGAEMHRRLNVVSAIVIADKMVEAVKDGYRLTKSQTDMIIDKVHSTSTMFDYHCVLSKYK